MSKRDRSWSIPRTEPIRDQAAERGEPVPVGKTRAELVEMGYDVRPDVAEFSVLCAEPTSPTGYLMAVSVSKLDELVEADGTLKEQSTVRVRREGEDASVPACVIGTERIISVGWLRKHLIAPGLSQHIPNWATVKEFGSHHGYLGGVNLNTIPAQAPTTEDFDAESARRVALGMPPLDDWRRPEGWAVAVAAGELPLARGQAGSRPEGHGRARSPGSNPTRQPKGCEMVKPPRVRRPRTKTKRCAHCVRRRLAKYIEWHPGIWEWQCSDFEDCDKAAVRAELGGRIQ